MKIKMILSIVAVLAVIVVIFFIVNGLVGNPISKYIVKKAAVKYIDLNYSELDLEIEKVYYNFKFDRYGVFVQSRTSKDTAFTIYSDSYGNIKEDDYAYEVANNFTTLRRLESELKVKADEMIKNKLNYDFENTRFRLVEENNEKDIDLNKLQLDMELDIYNPPALLEADVVIYTDNVSYDKIAEVARELEKSLREQKINVSKYSIRLIPTSDKRENEPAIWANSLSVTFFPANLISEDNLPKVMEEFEKKREEAFTEKP